MTQKNPEDGWDQNDVNGLASFVDELKRVSARLQQLSEELKAREEADAEMRFNYPHFKKIVYDLMNRHFDRELPPLPEGKDLETIAREEGALPLEAFYPELMQGLDGATDGK